MNAESIEDRVRRTLDRVTVGPDGPSIMAAGLVHDVVATGGAVRVLLDLDCIPDGEADPLVDMLTPLVRGLPGVERAVIKPRPRRLGTSRLPGIGCVLGVHSGKGGVGKSTIAANLAVALARRGARAGLLDADVYGPSAPTLLGIAGRATESADGRRIEPREAHGVKVMSLGFLMAAEKALIWRGSLVDEGLGQLFRDVAWGDLDVLVVDLPPGTSDVHLATARDSALDAVLTVTAPGAVSVQDVRRGMEMFADLAVPCLGIVENMAGVVCRSCGHVAQVFGSGGGPKLAQETGLPLLASIPFEPEVAAACDGGTPVVVAAQGSLVGQALEGLATELGAGLARLRIRVEGHL